MRKLAVRDIRDIVNDICAEVDEALENDDNDKFFYLVLLVYSLTENLVKWRVGTKQCWDEVGKEVKARNAGRNYHANLIQVRRRAKKLSFNEAITLGRSLGLFGVRLESRLHKTRIQRNDYAHGLWVIGERRNGQRLRSELEYLVKTIEKLLKVFDRLMCAEIRVDIPEVFVGL